MNTNIGTQIENMSAISAIIGKLPLPAHVKALPLALQEVNRTAAILEARIVGREREHAARCAAIAADVLDRRDGATGKPIASNDTARKAMIEQECAADEACQHLLMDLNALKRERAMALADAEALRAAVRLMSAPCAEISK